jgi:hypothetical protein
MTEQKNLKVAIGNWRARAAARAAARDRCWVVVVTNVKGVE